MGSPMSDVHELDPSAFLDETHSFEFWFQSVEGYLSGRPYGHAPDLEEPDLSDAERDRGGDHRSSSSGLR